MSADLPAVWWPTTSTAGASLCLLAPAVVAACSGIILLGAKNSARFNFVMMLFNLALVAFIVLAGSAHVDAANWTPFAPSGVRGVLDNAGFVFFSFIGFDCVCTLAEELHDPQRDLPLGIVLTLGLVTSLYVAVSMVLTGMQSYQDIGESAPLAEAFTRAGMPWAALLVALGE